MVENKASDGHPNGLSSTAPAITLPKGGGAISGVGEKFAANPVSGTGSMSVPISTSPGRSGFGPQLGLSYDSGAGNGPFGFGWSLSVPAITRKTDKGLPQYRDSGQSDVFILSGAEDLVPVLDEKDTPWEDSESVPGFVIHRYVPRIEGLFARIERWSNCNDPEDVHWRSISKDNILALYGRDKTSRILDPQDQARIFSWRICETRDTKGNAVVYEYKREDGDQVDLGTAHERNRGVRTDPRRSANIYLKRIKYGNRTPLLDEAGHRPRFLDISAVEGAKWCFEVVFDYGEHDPDTPMPRELPPPAGEWPCRQDPFSNHRAGFEVRTYRLCRRVLMFHHFPGELGVGQNCLVRSTDLTYRETPVASFMTAVTHSGYRRNGNGYLKGSFPAMEFAYSEAVIEETIHDVDRDTLENMPVGVDSHTYRFVDLDSEGISGVLTDQAGAWFYKPSKGEGRMGPIRQVTPKPSLAALGSGRQQLLDLAGDGLLDLVKFGGPTPGFYERNEDAGWDPFRTFRSLPNIAWNDPDLRFVDLDGDGRADVLITEHDAFTWYPSLGEEGFGAAVRVHQPWNEELGPHLVFADGIQQIYLADMCGDGLSDLVRIRSSEVCYWPNLGYGRFGAKVVMDNSPYFDNPDQFSQQRLRVADIDGSGNVDLIYLGRDGARLYFNQAGNAWSNARPLSQFPPVDNLTDVSATDFLGNGTACLVWSSPLQHDAGRQMRYIDLMGGQKPHLLIRAINNRGAETRIEYAPSTKFYLRDKAEGRPWTTRIPFPVHVIERVETYDWISRNRFVTSYAYHHGYFDGVERELRGFGMVEQWDTESLAALSQSRDFPSGENTDEASHVPPVHTKTWFHTGVYPGRGRVSNFFAGLLDARDVGEYYREPAWRDDDNEARKRLLDDTVLPEGLTPDEEREACRALKGAMLRQEIYALDGTAKAEHPYTVTEQNFTVRVLQPRRVNRHAVFFTHPREAINYHYERNPVDPRTSHTLTLEVDAFGNVLKQAAVAYGRRQADTSLPSDTDRVKQTRQSNPYAPLITYVESAVTNLVAGDDHHTPLPAEVCTYELTGYTPTGFRFQHGDFVQPDTNHPSGLVLVCDEEINYETEATTGHQRRLIEHVRTRYRADNFTGLLDPEKLEPLALPGESYKLAFTSALIGQVFKRYSPGRPQENLIPDPVNLLGVQGGYVDLDGDGRWWIPTGRVFFSPGSADTAPVELAYARQHFFQTQRYRDPFGQTSTVTFDEHDLLLFETSDPLGNRVTVGERRLNGAIDPAKPGNDYRVLQPWRVMDPNRNRTQVAFDALGMVVGTAVMGKPEENVGDTLAGFETDLTPAQVDGFYGAADPHGPALGLLKGATTRIVYDLGGFLRSQQLHPEDSTQWLPAYAATASRETHVSDPPPPNGLRIQISFSYSDGFEREIQKKVQAEPGPLVEGGSVVSPRWVVSGWTIFNNKGKPVRQYEPFFSQLTGKSHRFEFGVRVGVSPILFYDPVQRVVATLHPDHTYEKVIFDPWRQVTWDVNDTVLGDPRMDPDISGYTEGYFASLSASTPALQWQTWHAQRKDGALGEPARAAADKAAAHADTPTTAHFDTLGRPFLTIADNGPDPAQPSQHLVFATRVELDIEGNQQVVRDADLQFSDPLGRIVMRYAYDLLGNRIQQHSMEAGARWMLHDVTGRPLRAWDERGHTFRTVYDPLRRPLRSHVVGADPADPGLELLTERLVYGEQHPDAEECNLRGVLYLHLDQAGALTTEARDVKGNVLRTSRRLTKGTQYRDTVDWRSVDADNLALPTTATATLDMDALQAVLAPRLEDDSYISLTSYDALNRPTLVTTPHTPAMQPSLIRPGYNDANLIERVDASLPGATANGQRVWTSFVSNIDYDARGQRERIDYGNGASTFYDYDALTFRLVQLLTRREAAAFPGDCPLPTSAGWPGCQVQSVHYTYDPVGNVIDIRDDAQQTIYFRNKRVEPSAQYTYDATYRLTEATGREHLGQGNAPIPHSYSDALRTRLSHPGDGNALGRYIERFVYDGVGNFLEMQHHGADPVHPGWTRAYSYAETSHIEDGVGSTPMKISNRLSGTTLGGNNPPAESYGYDAHGNMTRMPHLGGAPPAANMQWDYRDQLRQTDLNGGGTANYVYDAAGQRVRKVWEKSPGLVEERIYFGGFEIYRRRQGAVWLERETLHIMDEKQRIAVVETRTLDTQGNDPAPQQLIRYQFGNHVGSVILELDEQAHIISYEEYTPYGSTSYQAVRSQTQILKRYRYTGKERDGETGLYYHGARYYAPWLGRWTSADPRGSAGGLNAFLYCRDRPNMTTDPEGTMDEEAKDVLKRLQQTIDEIPQKEFASLSAAEQGTRAHLTLESIITLDPKSPGRVANGVRLAPEVIVDTTGKIVAFGEPGQLGKASKDFRSIDVVLLKSPVTDVKELIGKNASDVIEAAIDYKTGAAKLSGVADMQNLIKAPYVKAVQGGNVAATLEAKVAKLSKASLIVGEGAEAAKGLAESAKTESKLLKTAEGLEGLSGFTKATGKRILMAVPFADLVVQQVFYDDLGYGLGRPMDAVVNLTVAEVWEIPIAVYSATELVAKLGILGAGAAADTAKRGLDYAAEKSGANELERFLSVNIGHLYGAW